MGEYADNAWDSEEDDEKDGVECKRCHKSGLVWEKHDDKWVLCTLGGKRHVCPKKTSALTDFKDHLE